MAKAELVRVTRSEIAEKVKPQRATNVWGWVTQLGIDEGYRVKCRWAHKSYGHRTAEVCLGVSAARTAARRANPRIHVQASCVDGMLYVIRSAV